MKLLCVTHVIMNYGSVLQAYALQKKFKEYGADTKIVLLADKYGKRNKIKHLFNIAFNLLKPMKGYSLYRRISLAINRHKFVDKNEKLSRFISNNIDIAKYASISDVVQDVNDCDRLVAGSDQIWSMVKGDVRPLFSLEWPSLPEHVKKYSYATSIGMDEVTDAQKNRFSQFLEDFEVVSFREENALSLLSSAVSCPTRCDLDPTLLYGHDFWDELASSRICKEPYIFVYMLRPNKRLIKMAKSLARKKKCKVIYTGLMSDTFSGVETICNAGVEEFLSYIKYSEAVITNSFHGTVFSILFEKKFVSVKVGVTSSRAENLLNKVGLLNRNIEEDDSTDVLFEDIDYQTVHEVLEREREKSLAYIRQLCVE